MSRASDAPCPAEHEVLEHALGWLESADRAAQIAAHLKTCEGCSRLSGEQQALLGEVSSLEPAEPTRDLRIFVGAGFAAQAFLMSRAARRAALAGVLSSLLVLGIISWGSAPRGALQGVALRSAALMTPISDLAESPRVRERLLDLQGPEGAFVGLGDEDLSARIVTTSEAMIGLCAHANRAARARAALIRAAHFLLRHREDPSLTVVARRRLDAALRRAESALGVERVDAFSPIYGHAEPKRRPTDRIDRLVSKIARTDPATQRH